jgi:hypothetical protein
MRNIFRLLAQQGVKNQDGDLPVRRGVVSVVCLKGIPGDSTKIPEGILGIRKKASFKVREVKQHNSAIRISYTLTQLADVF